MRADPIRVCPCDCARHACTALVTAHFALLGMRENRSGLSSRPPLHWRLATSLTTVVHGFSGMRADPIRVCPCDCVRHACTALVTAHPALLGMRENRSGLSSRPPRHWLVDASLNTVAHGFSGIRADSIRACPCDCARHACTALVTAHIALLGMRENGSGLSSRPPRN